MSRLCHCHRRCRHLVRGSDVLIGPERLIAADRFAPLEPMMRLLVDASDAFDAETLQFDPACGLHGTNVDRGIAECVCPGERFSAAEFVQALGLDVRAAVAKARYERGHRPRRMKDGRLRLAVAG